MILFKDIRNFRMYNKQVLLPLNTKNKQKGSLVYLLTPTIEDSINIINSNLLLSKYFNAYYIERDISFFITQESFLNVINSEEYTLIDEEVSLLNEVHNQVQDKNYYNKALNEIKTTLEENKLDYIIDEEKITIINNEHLQTLLEEDKNNNILSTNRYNQLLKQLLYRERFKTPSDIVPIYDKVKENCKDITKTYLYLEKYKNFNLYIDFFYYNQSFFANNYIKGFKGIYLYLELLSRFIHDDRFNDYMNKTLVIPVDGWCKTCKEDTEVTNYMENINPLSVLSYLMRKDMNSLRKVFNNMTILFTTSKSYFKLIIDDKLSNKDYIKFNRFINIMQNNLPIPTEDEGDSIESNNNSIVFDIVSRLETGKTKIKINNLTGGDSIEEKELLKRIEDASLNASDTEEAMELLDDDLEFKELLIKLSAQQSNGININKSRQARLETLDKELKKKTLKGVSIATLLEDDSNEELPVMDLSKRVDSVNNDDWANLKYVNIEKAYDINKDIVNIINDLSKKSYPIGIRNIDVKDYSTSEDYKDTYTVQCEDAYGKRFEFKFDLPKFKDGKFLIIKGNDKTINGQLFLLPISKTDPDTVQIVSDYNKIFIRRYGQKADSVSDRIIKTVEKMDSVKKSIGDCTIANNTFNLPYGLDYISKRYNKFETSKIIIYFNQEEIIHKYNITNIPMDKIPIAYDKVSKNIVYTTRSEALITIKSLLSLSDSSFDEIYDATNKGKKYMFSRATIMGAQIPLITVLSYNEGLDTVLKKAGIEYNKVEKLAFNKKDDNYDFIRFEDGFITYRCTDSANLLMNGLKDICTEVFSINDINSKSMWMEVLDNYGSRAKLADGLENFYDCMIDYPTRQALKYYQLPTEYTDVLLYANDLLVNTTYNTHTNMEAYRYRSNEIVTGYAYKEIAKAYCDYKDKIKKGYNNPTISMKQSCIIDEILMANTCGDASYSTPVGEIEMINTVSTKGHSGMNAERAYKIDKRSYDPSMINTIALATNFAGNAGINRQMTIDANVDTSRGYIKVEKDRNKMSITKSFSAEEALTPLGVTRNDPMRSAMDFIQTSKHQLRTKKSMPSLITNGMDQALPYMITNNFAFKAKQDGVIKEKTDQYVIIEYKDGTYDFIDVRNNIRKNSDGGFYITLQLTCDMNVGDKVKANDIVAYDKYCFSQSFGANDNITYNMGLLTKVAIMSTEEGFEDSTAVSQYLSDALTSYIDVKKDVSINKDGILLDIAQKGQKVQEGDTILVFQDAFDEEDVNILMKSLSDDVDLISDLGRFTIKAKANGIIRDIKVYRTCEYDELSESLKKLVDNINKPIKKMRSTMKKYDIEYVYGLEPVEKLPPTGKVKDVPDGIKIEIYLEYEDRLAIGDKIVDYSAVKGVTRNVWDYGKEPTSSYRKDEKIHTILCVASTLARMTAAPIIVGAINKVMIELDRHCKDIAGIKWKYLDQM